MKINLLSCIDSLKIYADTNQSALWEQTVVNSFWDDLCCYSPIDLTDRKPQPIQNMDALRQQIHEFEKLDLAALQAQFTRIANSLPNYDDDPISVMLILIDDDTQQVKERQNGVIGTSLFGNIMIQVNPLVKDYEQWIPYVFAHEYHHTVWGNYWYNLHGGESNNNLLQALLIDGEADSFAMSICQNLKPQWLYLENDVQIENLYLEKYKPILQDTEFDYSSLLFGNTALNIPWCAGYAIGYRLVQKFMKQNPLTFSKLIEIHPNQFIPISSMKSRLHTGELYLPNDPDVMTAQTQALERLYDFNMTRPSEFERRQHMLKEMFAEIGEGCYIEPPFHSNWGGQHVHFGDYVYANFNLTVVDDTHIYVGDHTMFGPNVVIATAGHPLLPELRERMYQYNASVHIGKNCWIGAGVIIVPGITIGNNVVIGAGSIVTKDIPSNVVAVGNPCHILRPINEHDQEYYFKDKKIDWNDISQSFSELHF